MVTMTQSTAKCATRTLMWIARIHSHTYINTVTTTLCEVPAHLLQNLESNVFLKLPEGGGANRSTRKKNLDSLPANTRYHIFGEKIQCPGRDWNPHPPTLFFSLRTLIV